VATQRTGPCPCGNAFANPVPGPILYANRSSVLVATAANMTDYGYGTTFVNPTTGTGVYYSGLTPGFQRMG
jgi:hypothetical protein